jgi:hypothetical protein
LLPPPRCRRRGTNTTPWLAIILFWQRRMGGRRVPACSVAGLSLSRTDSQNDNSTSRSCGSRMPPAAEASSSRRARARTTNFSFRVLFSGRPRSRRVGTVSAVDAYFDYNWNSRMRSFVSVRHPLWRKRCHVLRSPMAPRWKGLHESKLISAKRRVLLAMMRRICET